MTRLPRAVGTAAAAVLASGAAILPAAPAAAAGTSDDAGVVEFLTTGEVPLAVDEDGTYFAPGTVYFAVEISFPGGLRDYAATWERAGSPWPNTNELIAATGAYWGGIADTYRSGCRANAIRAAFAAYPTLAAFQASPFWTAQRADYFTAWQTTDDLAAAIDAVCPPPASEWTWSGVASDWDEATKTATVRIPFTEYGAGEQVLGLVASTVANAGAQFPADWQDRPDCIVSSWTDGPPATFPCGDYVAPAYTVRASTTITVPDLAEAGLAALPSEPPSPPLAAQVLGSPFLGIPMWLYETLCLLLAAGLGVLWRLLARRPGGRGAREAESRRLGRVAPEPAEPPA